MTPGVRTFVGVLVAFLTLVFATAMGFDAAAAAVIAGVAAVVFVLVAPTKQSGSQ